MKIFAGTTKGLLVFSQERSLWKLDSIHFQGLTVSMLFYHADTGHLWVGLAIKHWGPKLFFSQNLGTTWSERKVPRFPDHAEITTGKPAMVELIWSAAYQGLDTRLWIGTEPGGLFISDDEGQSFHLNESLWAHPSREEHWFGGGRNHAGIHSVLFHPNDKDKIYVGVSCGGVFRSLDNGQNWSGINQGLRADYLPDPYAKYGHDPHAILICRDNPNVIWQQNHCGVFRSMNGGDHWEDVTSQDGYGRYGFPLVIDHKDPGRAWIIPAESDEQRIAKDHRLVVCETKDGGKHWEQLTGGLPQENCFDLVFRHGFTRLKTTMAFGTTNGNLFISDNDGHEWQLISAHLPPIHSTQLID